MHYAQNALIIGLIGLAIYLLRLSAALSDEPEAPAPWQVARVIKAFRQRLARSRNTREKASMQRLLNGFYLLLIYTLIAFYFFLTSI